MAQHGGSPRLKSALQHARGFSVEYPYCLANHGPMILIVLDQMGASEDRMADWYRCYQAEHGLVPPPPASNAIHAGSWQEALGDRQRESDYRRFFSAETDRLGIHEVTRRYLPDLIDGVGASALHPLMRLAYGLHAADEGEVATALAYWAACYLSIGSPVTSGKGLTSGPKSSPDQALGAMTEDPADILAQVAALDGARDYTTQTDLLWHHSRAVGSLAAFAPLIGTLGFSAATPGRMAETALAVYAATMDFAALHGVTSLHWARLVADNLDDPEPLYRAVWQVIASLVPKMGFPALPSQDALQKMRQCAAPSWPDIVQTALGSNDEHDISLVFSARQEEMMWHDPLYRVLAARRVGLIA